MTQYFMIIDGKQTGPYPKENLLMAGLRPETPVWCQGMEVWMQAQNVPDVAELFQDSAFGTYAQPEIRTQFNSGSRPQYHSPASTINRFGNNPQHGTQQNSYLREPYPVRQPYNWMPLAIVSTVLGFLFSCVGLIFGIIAISSASKANTAYTAGNEIEGASNNSTAKIMTIIAFVLAGVGLLITMMFYGSIFLAFL